VDRGGGRGDRRERVPPLLPLHELPRLLQGGGDDRPSLSAEEHQRRHRRRRADGDRLQPLQQVPSGVSRSRWNFTFDGNYRERVIAFLRGARDPSTRPNADYILFTQAPGS
jgi:hypothetical protein